MLDFLVIWLHSLVWISFHLLGIRARDKYQHCDKGGTFFFLYLGTFLDPPLLS